MGRLGITEQQVFEAAESLVAQGLTPTVPLVREKLGVGSFSTVSAHLATWKKDRSIAVATVSDVPEKVQALFQQVAQQVWSLAFQTAQQDLDTQRLALESMRRELEQERAQMAGEIQRLEHTLDAAIVQVESLNATLIEEQKAAQEKEGELFELQIENARLGERVKAADERTLAAEVRAAEYKAQVGDLQDKLVGGVPLAKSGSGV